MQTDAGYDPAVWQRIGAELGWTAILIPEAYGGLGLGYVELVALMEEMGAALLCAPFFSTVCLATNVLLIGANEAQQAAVPARHRRRRDDRHRRLHRAERPLGCRGHRDARRAHAARVSS